MAIPVGIDIFFEREEDSRIKQESIESEQDNFPIGIKTPLENKIHDKDSLFRMHYSIEDQIKDNFKNLLMTRKGERLGFPDFGTEIDKIYAQSLPENEIIEYVMTQIQIAVSKYMPSLSLEEFYSTSIDGSIEKFRREKAKTFYSSQNNIDSNNAVIKKDDLTKEQDEIYELKIIYKINGLKNQKNSELKVYVRTSR